MAVRGDGRRIGAVGKQKRRWDDENRPLCACGKPMRPGASQCRDCFSVKRDVRRAAIGVNFNAGKTYAEIGRIIGWATSSVGPEVKRMREDGWDLGPVRLGRRPKRV